MWSLADQGPLKDTLQLQPFSAGATGASRINPEAAHRRRSHRLATPSHFAVDGRPSWDPGSEDGGGDGHGEGGVGVGVGVDEGCFLCSVHTSIRDSVPQLSHDAGATLQGMHAGPASLDRRTYLAVLPAGWRSTTT